LTGFASVTLDGKELPVSGKAVHLDAETAITRPTAHSIVVDTPEVSFSLVNADGFFNIEQATLLIPESDDMLIEGLLGQTAVSSWKVENTAAFKQHMIYDYLISGADLFSDDFVANQYQAKQE